MNEINAAQRKRVAAQELARSEQRSRSLLLTASERKKTAYARGRVLPSNGRLLIDGLADSIKELKGPIDLTEEQIVNSVNQSVLGYLK